MLFFVSGVFVIVDFFLGWCFMSMAREREYMRGKKVRDCSLFFLCFRFPASLRFSTSLVSYTRHSFIIKTCSLSSHKKTRESETVDQRNQGYVFGRRRDTASQVDSQEQGSRRSYQRRWRWWKKRNKETAGRRRRRSQDWAQNKSLQRLFSFSCLQVSHAFYSILFFVSLSLVSWSLLLCPFIEQVKEVRSFLWRWKRRQYI